MPSEQESACDGGRTHGRQHPYFRSGVELISGNQRIAPVNVCPGQRAETDTNGHLWTSPNQTHDIFEGTEQFQQLVISRAISGLRVE